MNHVTEIVARDRYCSGHSPKQDKSGPVSLCGCWPEIWPKNSLRRKDRELLLLNGAVPTKLRAALGPINVHF